jgi:2-(1,2-epoxy-1,2-dihydrophenyl)acetyl-CoA isomerase
MTSNDVVVSGTGHVVTVELNRPPANHFDEDLLRELADVLDGLAADRRCRAAVLCSAGKHFCAGADFSTRARTDATGGGAPDADSARRPPGGGLGWSGGGLYRQAMRLFESTVPVVAAVQGAAVGGGLGLACAADFRVATPQTRFVANFSRLGFHHGFGLTVTLPAIVGQQAAMEMLYTSARVDGTRALQVGLVDRLVPAEELRAAALRLAGEIAEAAPLAVAAIRGTMRRGLAARVREALDHELVEQDRLSRTADWAEGVRASFERRTPSFEGR